jgi:hypothetical protein
VHGDFDFYENIRFDGDFPKVVDFEAFQREGLPFYDLATLIYHPILMSYWKLQEDVPLSVYINNFSAYIKDWLQLYSRLSGMPMRVVRFFVQIAVLEELTREFPYYRDPKTYLMNSAEVANELIGGLIV